MQHPKGLLHVFMDVQNLTDVRRLLCTVLQSMLSEHSAVLQSC